MPDNPLSSHTDPWDTRFGFFWYNDHEIFHATQDDLNRQAEAFAATGINHVITFSCTHFRWSFRRRWDVITETLSRVVQACHLHGIRVTEHHSSHLTFNPLNAEEEDYMERVLHLRGGSSSKSWPYLREDCDADPDIGGVPLSAFRQIDGRTGKWARTGYRGWCLCFNNPDYRRAYLAYLETLYAVGIDGIMTDDVQWFGEGHSCACPHCRRLFVEQTGYKMPDPGPDWEAWHGNYDDPSYVAWLDFRFRSNEDFHAAVKAHYDALGLRPLRPNYVSTALARNWTAYTLETLPDLDWVFQECCFSTIIRVSWPHWAVEAGHRFAVGRRRGIPAMAMFYPDRPDTMLFTWGLAMSWGQMYLATPEGFSLNEQEKELRAFEKAHARLLRGQKRLSRLGFYDSRTNRNLYGDAEARSLSGLRTWIQACYRRNVPFDLFQQEELDRLKAYRVVVLNEVALLSEEELAAFRAFVHDGGTLVWTGRTGTKDERGVSISGDEIARLWDLEGTVCVEDGGAMAIHPIGKGKLATMAGDFGLGPIEPKHDADRLQTKEVRVPFQAVSDEERKTWEQITNLLIAFLPDGPDLETKRLPRDVMVTAYETVDGSALTLHFVNAAGTLDVSPGSEVGHRDPIPFPRHAGPPIRISVRKPRGWSGCRITEARYLNPETEEAVSLKVGDDGAMASVEIDPKLIQGYGLVELRRFGK